MAREDALGRRQRDAAGNGCAKAAKLRASAGTPSWSSIAAMLPGMKGCSTVAIGRSTSASTRSTAAIRTGSVLRSAQGAWRSM